MKIGVAGPVELNLLKDHLYQEYRSTTDRIQGLGGSQVTQLVHEYLRLGHKVSVYTLDQGVADNEVLRLTGTNFQVYVGPFRRGRRVTLDFQSVERRSLHRFMIEDQADVIHAHWTYEFAQAAIASGLPHVVTVRDWAPTILRLMPKPYRLMRLIMNHNTLKKASYLTANSPYIAQKLKTHYKRDVPVVPNGISSVSFHDARKELNRVSPVIVNISNGFGKTKNVHSLIRAHAIYNKNATNKAHLRLIGSGLEKWGEASRWVVANNLDSSHISFMGQLCRDSVMQELARADLLVHPALEESFGNTLIEAMASKVPVIAGQDSGATAWVLDGGKAGKLTDVTNPEAIAMAIDEVLSNESIWRSYSDAGHSHAKQSFCMTSVSDQFINTLSRVRQA